MAHEKGHQNQVLYIILGYGVISTQSSFNNYDTSHAQNWQNHMTIWIHVENLDKAQPFAQ